MECAAEWALYPPISSSDGEPLSALHDYTISMTASELPPATAFSRRMASRVSP